MDLGKYIESARINKNLSVQDLIKGQFSKSTYSRFINGDSQISVDKFFSILERLDISLLEFLGINTKILFINNWIEQLSSAIMIGDMKIIETLKSQLLDEDSVLETSKKILSTVADHALDKPIDSQFIKDVVTYWQKKEYLLPEDLFALCNLFDLIDEASCQKFVIRLILPQSGAKATYDDSQPIILYRILSQWFRHLALNKQVNQAKSFYYFLTPYSSQSEDLYFSLESSFNQAIFHALNAEDQVPHLLESYRILCQRYGLHKLYQSYCHIFDQLMDQLKEDKE
ncbi:helix-turn-helix domain-containing protein [Facklamia hominis]|uniref:helix-turn-helix domain-containing protein n=1 Tax=Facklamia hominis TaxID=178214 RepID=UPI000C79A460|nr:helix-turn-helix transcriptional regulator [Facklamia hominis]PKY93415.1 hypothetical protein CYJ56_02985 [Facklamia hominis]